MNDRHQAQSLFVEGPAGPLEAILWLPSGAAPSPLAALVCHPHPLFGGTMHNKVVYQAAKTFAKLGLPVLRFNFRGAGLSAGKHDKGIGEQDDVRSALDFLAKQFPGMPILLAGFSFGCWVGLRVGCSDPRVKELVGMGAPVNDSDFSYLQSCAKPKLFLQGGSDPYGAPAELERLAASLPGENQVVVVEGADHFFAGYLDRMTAALLDWLRSRHPEFSR
ncbi:MAG TPA: alpha/beta family hydrolase [Candidatus Acidoferrales bacterium]|nr:alpha/beta family hydrolase [Candidatus Acidoferrales bacterium]